MPTSLSNVCLPGKNGDILRSLPEWDAALGPDWPRRVMAVTETDRKHEKQGRSIVRWAVSDSLTVYLKRHFVLSPSLGWLARFFPRRAWSPGLQEWEHLSWARSAGLPVPRPVAAGEFRGQGSKIQSFLAVEELTGMSALHEAIPAAVERLTPSAFVRWKRGLILELARLCREMHRRRAFHRDLYLCHFFIHDTDISQPPGDWYGRVVMIDFHRLGKFPFTWPVWQVKDLAQFLFSTFDVPGIGARDRVRFWKHYRDGDWGTSSRPPGVVSRFARWKAAGYARHNARHDLAVARKD
jgi:Lipopolysaccharide kinase (Kdo/WaaP) family